MKKFFKVLSFISLVAGITWALRDQLLPGPEAPTSHPPAFRAPPPAQESAEMPAADNPANSAEPADDLTRVNGIGPVYAKKLAEQGIMTFTDLAAADADEVAARGDIARDRVADWINKAADLA